MNAEIQVISDGDGLAIVGEPGAVERVIADSGLPSKDLVLPRVTTAAWKTGAVVQAGAETAAMAGRWVKLTPESAALMKKLDAMKGSTADVSRAILTKDGKTKHIMEFAKSSSGAALTNPAALAGVAGLMAQLAMQQTMDEITDYLAAIDEKVDDILRAQKDGVLSRMIGARLVIEEAMTIRSHAGGVSDVTWTKVQGVPTTIAETQAYALRQLDAIAEKLEKTSIGDLVKASKQAEVAVQEWLAVLAQCFKLQDGIAVLELDRVLAAAPEDLDRHRVGLRAARDERRELISRTTASLLTRAHAAAATANAKVLFNPTSSRAVVQSSNEVTEAIFDFDALLGIQHEGEVVEARVWKAAAVDARDKALESGAAGLDAAKRRSTTALDRAKGATGDVTGKLSSGIAARVRRRNREDEDSVDKDG